MPNSARGSGASSPSREAKLNRGMAGKAPLLRQLLELERMPTRDGSARWTIKPVQETLTFDKGFYVFVRALQLLKANNTGVILVGLGGASGSGKTAFSEKIKSFMPGVVVISMDMYNDGSKVVDQNFDDPRLTDYDTLLANLADLKAGRATQVPIYDFKSSSRVGYDPTPVPASRVVILEGIYALNEKLRPMMDLRVSITGGVHFDLVKRVMRDITRVGQGPEAIVQQITETVYPMYKAFIEPDLQTAQLRIYNAFNPFSGFMHPTYILKSAAALDLDLVRTTLRALGEDVSEATDRDLADIYLLPPGEDPETCQTWLRMRNKDGRYTLMFEEWVTEEPFIISPRITFEVSVKILGGLLALGYEIGTIMRRTSRIFKVPSVDITVKIDDVTNLGTFVQLLGKERQRVAQLGHDLGLDGTYICRPYIEQVQLEQLTADFAAVNAEVRDRLTSGEHTSGKVLMDILAASPPARMPRRKGGGVAIRRASVVDDDGPDDDAHSLSCSAPPDAPVHMLGPTAGQLSAALTGRGLSGGNASSSGATGNGPLSGVVSASHSSTHPAAGSTGNGATISAPQPSVGPPGSATHSYSGGRHGGPMGLLSQQLHGGASGLPPPASPAPATRTQSGFSPAPHAVMGGLREAPYTPIGRNRSSGQLAVDGLAAGAGGGAAGLPPPGPAGNHEGGGGGTAGLSRAVDLLDSKLQRISTSSSNQFSEMKLQLDVLVTQYQSTNAQLQQLSEATTALAASLQATTAALATHLQQQQAALLATGGQAGGSPATGWEGWRGVLLPASVALGASAVATALIFYLQSHSTRSAGRS